MEYKIKPTGTRWTLYKIVNGKQQRVTTAVNRNILLQTIEVLKMKKRKSKLKKIIKTKKPKYKTFKSGNKTIKLKTGY